MQPQSNWPEIDTHLGSLIRQPSLRQQLSRVEARAVAEARVRARAGAQVQAKVRMWAQMQVLALAEARLLAEAPGRVQAQVEAPAPVQAEAEAEAEAKVKAEAEARARVEAEAEARARVQAKALVEAEARARSMARALKKAEALAESRAESRIPEEARTQLARWTGRTWSDQTVARAGALALALDLTRRPPPMARRNFTYSEVLADSKLKDIIDSISPDHRRWLAHRLWRKSYMPYMLFIQIIIPITRLPPELLQQIFLIIIDEASHSPLILMLVCKDWYTIVTGIWASLKLGTRTPIHAVTRKLKWNQWLLDVVIDTEIDRGDFTPSKRAYQAIFAAIEATSRWRTFVVETFPVQTDLPEHLVNHGLKRCSNAIMNCLRTFKIKSACEISPLLDRLLHILGTSASGELTTVEINSANAISFLAPYSSMFHSIKVLCLDTPGRRNPVDILPHLHQLEALTASHLSLPIYHNDVALPFVHTLRRLSLRAVSIQWMSGRTFHTLESCTLLFPLHHNVLHGFSATLPKCKSLTFQGHPLNILDGLSAQKLTHLSVMSSCSHKPRGDPQLIRFASHALQECRLAPRILHISIEATAQAWIKALAFMSNLEELVIDNAQPSSLGLKVLQSLVVHPVHANNLGSTTTTGRLNTPACPSLKRLRLRYRRWLRSSEHFDLIPEFMSIIWSRQWSKFSLQSFQIWTTSDQVDPLELIEGLSINLEGFYFLADDCAIKEEDFSEQVTSRVEEEIVRIRAFLTQCTAVCPCW